MHTKTKKSKSFYAKESKQKRFFLKKKYVSVDLQHRTKRRAWTVVLIYIKATSITIYYLNTFLGFLQ